MAGVLRESYSCPRYIRKTASGLTLLELLVGLTIVAIAMALAVPAFDAVIARNQLAVGANRIMASAITARHIAANRNQAIAFCAGNLEQGCHGEWGLTEWLVFADQNKDGVIDEGDKVYVAEQMPRSYSLAITANGPLRTRVIFTATGAAQTASGAFAAGRIRLCTQQSNQNNATDLVLIGSGRIVTEPRNFSGLCPTP